MLNEMSVLINTCKIMIINYFYFSTLLILSIQGLKRSCMDKDPLPEELFSTEHHGDVGFPRDVGVELGRNLHQRLHLTQETKPCARLASTRTSTCWPWQGCRKWKREDKKNAKAYSDVMNKSITMVQDFITVVAKEHKSIDITDQTFIFECVETAVDRLRKSGLTLYSKTDEQKVKLINEIEQLKPAFCGGYLQQLASEIEKRQADYLAEQSKKESLEAQAQTRREAEGNPKAVNEKRVSNEVSRQGIEIADLPGRGKRRYEEPTDSDRNMPVINSNGINLDEKEMDAEMGNTDTTADQMTKITEEKLPLHESIFRRDYRKMDGILRGGYDVNKKDKHGNTALHLAVMLGRRVFAKTLLDYGASVRKKNLLGWSPMDEAISYGDEATIKLLMLVFPKQIQNEVIPKRRILLEELIKIPDFYMELHWEFRFTASLANYFLPADLCIMRKRGKSIRVDWSLMGLTDTFIKRYKYGHVALLFNGHPSPALLYFMDVKKKRFMMRTESGEETTEEEAEYSARKNMRKPIFSGTISMDNAAYTQVKDSLPGNSFKTEKIGPFQTFIYTVNGVVLTTKERTEHLPKKDENKNNKDGEDVEIEEENDDDNNEDKDNAEKKKKREKEKPLPPLPPPPPPTDVTWEEYIDVEPGKYRTLAREMVEEEKIMKVKESTLAMVPQFPITKGSFVKILSILTPFKQFEKLREFVEMKLPPGFPVRLEVPIMFGLSARVTILTIESSERIAEKEILSEDLFTVPKDYTEMSLDEENAYNPMKCTS